MAVLARKPERRNPLRSRNAGVSAVIDPPKGSWRSLEISIRHPESQPIREVRVNGARYAGFEPGGAVRLTPGAARFSVEVLY